MLQTLALAHRRSFILAAKTPGKQPKQQPRVSDARAALVPSPAASVSGCICCSWNYQICLQTTNRCIRCVALSWSPVLAKVTEGLSTTTGDRQAAGVDRLPAGRGESFAAASANCALAGEGALSNHTRTHLPSGGAYPDQSEVSSRFADKCADCSMLRPSTQYPRVSLGSVWCSEAARASDSTASSGAE